MAKTIDRPLVAVLVGCVAPKADQAAPAADLYRGQLWNARRRYAERVGLPWFILSAEHGLLHPADQVAPYDTSMASLGAAGRVRWARRVVVQLHLQLGARLLQSRVEVHAGELYRQAIETELRLYECELLNPLAGLGIGQQLGWYAARRREGGEG